MSVQSFHVHEIETPTLSGGKHTRFIYAYDQTVDQCNQLMTVLESNNREIKKINKAIKKVNSNNSYNFEKEIDQIYYPMLIRIGAVSGLSKIVSRHLKITSRELLFNPDWDIDIILNLFNLFGKYLSWDPPQLPNISSKINGKKNEIDLKIVQKAGLKKFIKHNKIFSYAITSPKKFKYTVFDKIQ